MIIALISIPLLGLGILSYQAGWAWYTLIVSSLHVVYGLRMFIRRGGSLLTASGLYGLASAVFLGLPPLWTYLAGAYSIDKLDCFVSAISFACLALTDLISRMGRRQKHTRTAKTTVMVQLDDRVICWMLGFSAMLFVIGSVMNTAGLSFAEPMVYVSSMLSAAAAIIAIGGRKWLSAMLSCVLTSSILAVYLGVYFTGLGRLIIATLGISCMVAASVIWKSSWIKAVSLLASGPLLVVAAQIRSSSVITAQSLLENPLKGLSSMLAPYFTFREVLVRVGMPGSLREFPFQWGRTLVLAALFWVPRRMWPSKPMSLGSQYTVWFRPDLVEFGHTMAGSYLGELYVNFGFLGLLAAPLIVGIVLRLFDTAIYRLAAGPRGSHLRYCWTLVLTSIIVGGIADYVWAGILTAAFRAVPRLIVLIPIAAVGLGEKRHDEEVGRARYHS